MIMNNKCKNNKGFTLLEVLLSIVLLFIISTSFIGFFTQSAMFTQKNKEKLNAVQIAQKYINLVEQYVKKNDLNSYDLSKPLDESEIDKILSAHSIHLEKSSFKISAKVTPADKDLSSNLVQFKIIVQDPDEPNNESETYTYLRE